MVQDIFTTYQISLEICGAVFCAVCLFMLTFFRSFDRTSSAFLTAMLAVGGATGLSEAIALSFGANNSRVSFYMVRIMYFITFLLIYVMTAVGLLYFRHFILSSIPEDVPAEKISGAMFYTTYIGIGVCAVGGILLIASQFTEIFYRFDEYNNYHPLQSSFLQQLIPCCVLLAAFFISSRYLRYTDIAERICLIIAIMVLTASFIILVLPDYIMRLKPAFGLFSELAGIIIFAGYISSSARKAIKREQVIAAKDSAIREQKIRIMQNQIRPHFIFNSLLAIKQLCIEDPKQAAESIQHFSGFLRANLEAMTDEKPVPVTKEIDCIKEYIELEQADPASRFTVKYDIGFTDFCLPLLSAEPMVENAIRHGIATKKNGGVVRISTSREGNSGVLTIEDNGQGFGSETAKQAEHRSIGIQNSKDRLMLMCGGDLSIANTGSGTIVRITVPLNSEKES